MKLHELIEQCGDDVFFQNMDETTANIDYTAKNGIRAKIAVPGEMHGMIDVPGGWKRLGLIVWLPRDKVAEAMSGQDWLDVEPFFDDLLTAPSASAQQAEPVAPTIYVECNECSYCGHVGINDYHPTDDACSDCDWSGPRPVEDKCPGCEKEGTMVTACSKCGRRTSVIAEARLAAPAPSASPEKRCTCGGGALPGSHSRTCLAFDESMMTYEPFGKPAASPDTFPARLLHESDASLAERVDSWHKRNPAPSASPAALTLDANEVEFLAARLRRLLNHFKYPLPDWAKDDKHLIGIAPTCIGAVLANLSKAEEAELAQGVLDDLARKGLAASPADQGCEVVAGTRSAVQAFSEARSQALNVDWYTWQIAWKYARDEE